MPTWLMAVVFALVFAAVGTGIYWLVGNSRDSSAAAHPALENAGAKAAAGAANPLQKYIEVVGVRWVPMGKDKKQVGVRFVLVNHSEAEIPDLAGTVSVLGKSQKASEAEGTFSFKTTIGPLESKELTQTMETTRKIYELPDWQFVTADLRITAPSQ